MLRMVVSVTQCTIHSFAKLPKLEAFRNALPHTLGEKAGSLNAEGNKYYEANSGIGFHGDSERKIVVCLSLGKDSMVLTPHTCMDISSTCMLPCYA